MRNGRAVSARDVTTDSRAARKGSLFIAIVGPRNDGHDYIGQAIEQGASAVLVSQAVKITSAAVWVIQVKDTTQALGELAAYHRSRFDIPVVAVTGSAGKTTTKEMIAAVLGRRYNVLKNNKTENNQYGLPMTLLKLRPRHEAVVVEIGTNHFGEIAYLAAIARPTIAVMTNIGASHLEFLRDKAGVFREKSDLIKYTHAQGAVIFNVDDAFLSRIVKQKLPQKKISYGILKAADVRAVIPALDAENGKGVRFKVGKRSYRLRSITGHNVYNALAAIAVGRSLKMNDQDIASGLDKWRPVKGRQCLVRRNGITLIDDTYNANPLSFGSAIETLAGIKSGGRKLIVCGDMKELGADTLKWHCDIGKAAGKAGVDAVFSIGHYSRHIGDGARGVDSRIHTLHFEDTEDLQKNVAEFCVRGDVVLIKGSRSMQMDKVVTYLTTR